MDVDVKLGGCTILPLQTLQKVQIHIGQIIPLTLSLLHHHTMTQKLLFPTGLNPLQNRASINYCLSLLHSLPAPQLILIQDVLDFPIELGVPVIVLYVTA